jgi:predicted helicase
MFESDDIMDEMVFQDNNAKVSKQKNTDIRVVIGNPPYSKGQSDANQDNPNMKYPDLDDSIRQTYVRHSKSALSNSSYDSYFKAFRWASNRIKEQGIICYVTNGSWIDSNSADGFRKSIYSEFSKIYVFNLRGNQRTQGELSRMEGGKVFGEGSRTPVAVTLLIKNPQHKGETEVYYHDVGDYLTREEKLLITANAKSIDKLSWTKLYPNLHGDWINQRNEEYSTFIPLSDKSNKGKESQAIFKMFSMGIHTNRDAWTYNFSKKLLIDNARKMVTNYNKFLKDYNKSQKSIGEITRVSKEEISWSSGLLSSLKNGKSAVFKGDEITLGIYRPFQKMWLYRENLFIERRSQTHILFPPKTSNLVIYTTGPGASVDFGALITDTIPNHHFMDTGQGFPMYYYPETSTSKSENLLFDLEEVEPKLHAISDWALNEFCNRYSKKLTKEDIFYYVYGVLSAPEFQKRFKNDLKKQAPRGPFLDDFSTYSDFGRKLAELHLGYESMKNTFCKVLISDTKIKESELYKVEKIRFEKNKDFTALVFNKYITIHNIPEEVLQYSINGRSPMKWVMDKYLIKEDGDTAILNDPNAYSEEPKYVFNLLLSVIAMTKEILELQKSLPNLVIPKA